jgi:hypothetical protein
VASSKRVSVEDAEAVYRRLQKISDLLDRLPPSGEIMAIGGATDFMIPAVSQFGRDLNARATELNSALLLLQMNTEQAIANVRRSVQEILDTDTDGGAQARKLSAETERLGAKSSKLTGR